jgi:hypothetical protein
MLASITPLGERGRNNSYWFTAVWHIAGAVVGGAAIGTLAGAIGAVRQPSTVVANAGALVVALLALVFDLRVGGLRLPTVRRQVNERWLDEYRGWVYGVGFGAQLGAGVVTIVTTAATYAALLLATLTGSVAGGALIGLVFGLVRGASVLITARTKDANDLRSLHRSMARLAPRTQGATLAMYAVGAVSASLLLIGSGA